MTTTMFIILNNDEIKTRVTTHYKDAECICEFVNTFPTPEHFCDSLGGGLRKMK